MRASNRSLVIRDEYVPPCLYPPPARQYTNRHGYRGAADALLQKADRNGDGKLSLSEMQGVQLDEVPHELLVLLTSHDPRVEL